MLLYIGILANLVTMYCVYLAGKYRGFAEGIEFAAETIEKHQ